MWTDPPRLKAEHNYFLRAQSPLVSCLFSVLVISRFPVDREHSKRTEPLVLVAAPVTRPVESTPPCQSPAVAVGMECTRSHAINDQTKAVAVVDSRGTSGRSIWECGCCLGLARSHAINGGKKIKNRRKKTNKNTPNRETGGRPAIEVDVEKINSGGPAANGTRRRHTFLSKPCHPGTPAWRTAPFDIRKRATR